MATIQWPSKEKRRLLGQRVNRVDGPVKSTGAAKYTYDISRPGMLYAKILYSSIASGVLKSLDTRAAEAMQGVAAVHVMTEPGQRVNWAGQEIAAIEGHCAFDRFTDLCACRCRTAVFCPGEFLLCLVECAVKFGDIQGVGALGSPLQGLGFGLQIELGIGHVPAHPIVELAQLAACLGVGRVGPKEIRKVLP